MTLSGTSAADSSGVSVAGAGDLNGDGYDDLLIGAYHADISANADAGASYLIYGSLSLPMSLNLSNADATFTGIAASDFSGRSVAGAGDINGDGLADLIIGAYGAAPGGNNNAGTSYLFFGRGQLPFE